ncbi:hypothetical protein V1512DRAFT_260176 [Lipomyces arxii]|uniref:uncharacterized protein n=1 Tax=Lipomyces arxii TaxID=56418 RepID=UPI0034CD0751
MASTVLDTVALAIIVTLTRSCILLHNVCTLCFLTPLELAVSFLRPLCPPSVFRDWQQQHQPLCVTDKTALSVDIVSSKGAPPKVAGQCRRCVNAYTATELASKIPLSVPPRSNIGRPAGRSFTYPVSHPPPLQHQQQSAHSQTKARTVSNHQIRPTLDSASSRLSRMFQPSLRTREISAAELRLAPLLVTSNYSNSKIDVLSLTSLSLEDEQDGKTNVLRRHRLKQFFKRQ